MPKEQFLQKKKLAENHVCKYSNRSQGGGIASVDPRQTVVSQHDEGPTIRTEICFAATKHDARKNVTATEISKRFTGNFNSIV